MFKNSKKYIVFFFLFVFFAQKPCSGAYLEPLTKALTLLQTNLTTLKTVLKKDTGEKKALQNMGPSSIWVTAKAITDEGDAMDFAGSKRQKVKCFIADCEEYKNENQKIPKRSPYDKILRIATYNVNEWVLKEADGNFSKIQSVIKTIEADIIIMQEVRAHVRAQDKTDNIISQKTRMKIYNPETKQLEEKDMEQEFTEYNSYWVKIPGYRFGNMILCKKNLNISEPKAAWYKESSGDEKRGYITITCSLPNDKKLTLYGTHLDVVSEEYRLAEVQEFVEQTKNSPENIVFMGDFNAIRKQDYLYEIGSTRAWNLVVLDNAYFVYRQKNKSTAITDAEKQKEPPLAELEYLEKAGFEDCFSMAKLVGPKFTNWTGKVVDFIFLKKDTWNLPIKGCYVYYAAASDHLPIIMDIGLE